MDIRPSDTVVSLAGRDKGQWFFVVNTDENFLYLADGKGRPLERPKRKKPKHVRKASETHSPVADKIRNGDKVLNSELRRELAVLAKNSTVKTKGVN